MTKWNQISGAFAGHDCRNSRYAQHIAFFCVASSYQRQRRGQHTDTSLGTSHPLTGWFVCHVDHMRLSGGIEMT